jgi:hypothetical protein
MQPDAAARTECQSRLDEDAELRAPPGADAGARLFHQPIESTTAAGLVVETEALLPAAQLVELREQAKARAVLQ